MKRLAVLLLCLMLVGCSCPSTPEQITILTQAPTAQTVVISESPSITATPFFEPTPTPEPFKAEDGIYTIAWLSDPQHYSRLFPEIYYSMTDFLSANRDSMNLGYIVFTGDFVHNNDDELQWQVADRAMQTIEDIPNGILAGNHDMEPSTGGYELYYKYFGEQRYSDKPYYGDSFENNRGHYDLITLGSTDYIFIYMSHAPSGAARKWAKTAADSFPGRVAVLCLHDYFLSDGTLSEDGQKWSDEVVSACPNIYMVLCGHKYGVYCTPTEFDDDGDGVKERRVLQMMVNYQAAGDYGGDGYLRLMQFDKAEGTIRMLTYSPYRDDYNMFDEGLELDERYWMQEDAEEFSIGIPWH